MSGEAARRIEDLCKLRGLSVSKLLKDCGLNAATVTEMKSKGIMPAADKIVKVAVYFGVSAEYIVTGKEMVTSVTVGDVTNSNGVGQVNAPVTVVNSATSKESAELLRIFEGLTFKRRLELLNKTVELEENDKK